MSASRRSSERLWYKFGNPYEDKFMLHMMPTLSHVPADEPTKFLPFEPSFRKPAYVSIAKRGDYMRMMGFFVPAEYQDLLCVIAEHRQVFISATHPELLRLLLPHYLPKWDPSTDNKQETQDTDRIHLALQATDDFPFPN